MSFNGNEGEQITLAEGAALTKKYRDGHQGATRGMFLGRTHVEAILAQGDCKGLRMYLGENLDGSLEFVFVGADSNGNDLLDLIIDRTYKCPPECGSSNPLNSDLKK